MLQIALATPRQHIQIAAFEDSILVREWVDVQVVFDESAQAGLLVAAAQSRRRRRAEWNGINLDCGLLRVDHGRRVGWTNWGLAICHSLSIMLVSGRSHATQDRGRRVAEEIGPQTDYDLGRRVDDWCAPNQIWAKVLGLRQSDAPPT
jgi:hypothetical protein